MPEPLERLRVLVVDDAPSIRSAIVATLEAEGAAVVAVGSSAGALEACRRNAFDVVILDQCIGGGGGGGGTAAGDTGVELLPVLLAEAPWMKVILITAYASFELAVQAIQRGACNFLPKPFTAEQLRVLVGEAARQRRVEQRLADSSPADGADAAEASGIHFASAHPGMTAAVELARQVAATDATVLICGETGTGKGELAKAIHRWSARSGRPLAVVACPSLSADLLESELFGHRRGAFTHAVRDNPGRVAACDGGTLFLDEVADLPLAIQPKLLRFAQDRQYERVGEPVTRTSDVRILAATNVSLDDAVRAGRFREDLLYRLNVIQIEIPPLRARPEDAVALARRLLARFAASMNKRPPVLTDAAVDSIRRYPWPGNVRELRNVCERAVILARGDTVGPDLLRLDAGAARPATGAVEVGSRVPLEQIEREHIRGVLASTSSIDEAAEVLGMDSVTLWRRRKKFGLD
jgi:NtrC-family two-component system response regulator AlgB